MFNLSYYSTSKRIFLYIKFVILWSDLFNWYFLGYLYTWDNINLRQETDQLSVQIIKENVSEEKKKGFFSFMLLISLILISWIWRGFWDQLKSVKFYNPVHLMLFMSRYWALLLGHFFFFSLFPCSMDRDIKIFNLFSKIMGLYQTRTYWSLSPEF